MCNEKNSSYNVNIEAAVKDIFGTLANLSDQQRDLKKRIQKNLETINNIKAELIADPRLASLRGKLREEEDLNS